MVCQTFELITWNVFLIRVSKVIIKIVFGVSDKMSNRHSVLCWTFWFPAGHFATWKCLATFVSSAGHFLHIVHCLAKCPSVLELSAGHFRIVPDMSGMSGVFDNHWTLALQTNVWYVNESCLSAWKMPFLSKESSCTMILHSIFHRNPVTFVELEIVSLEWCTIYLCCAGMSATFNQTGYSTSGNSGNHGAETG